MEKQRNARGEGGFKTNPDGTVTRRKTVVYKANGCRKISTVTANNRACIKEMKKREAAREKEKASEQGSTKNSKARKIKLKREAVDILIQLRERTDDEPEELIVQTRTGKANTATNLERGPGIYNRTVLHSCPEEDHGGRRNISRW